MKFKDLTHLILTFTDYIHESSKFVCPWEIPCKSPPTFAII